MEQHLVGRTLPAVSLTATNGDVIDLAGLRGLTVVYTYPRNSPPDCAAIPGWAEIPRAKGCTAQSCGFRDHHTELSQAGAAHVFGLSTQSTEYQSEVVSRLHLPFACTGRIVVGSLALHQADVEPVSDEAMSSIIRSRSGVVFSCVIRSSCLTIEKAQSSNRCVRSKNTHGQNQRRTPATRYASG